MSDKMAQQPTFASELGELGRNLEDLVEALAPPLSPGAQALLEAPAMLALPPADEHTVNAQVLKEHTPGWHVPHPSKLPAPSYAPAVTAFGIVFLALGAVTMWPLSVIGAAIILLGLATWIGDLL